MHFPECALAESSGAEKLRTWGVWAGQTSAGTRDPPTTSSSSRAKTFSNSSRRLRAPQSSNSASSWARSRMTTRSVPTNASRSSTPPRRPRSRPSATRSIAASLRSRVAVFRRQRRRSGLPTIWGRRGGGGGPARRGTRPRRARSRAARRSRRDRPRGGDDPCVTRAGRCRAAARRTRASRGRGRRARAARRSGRTAAARVARRGCVCAASELHRRARLATDARRSARGSSDQSLGSWLRTASSTMPSRSAQSLAIKPSSSNSSSAVTSSVEPAGSSSARRCSSSPGMPPALRGLRLHDPRRAARSTVGARSRAARSCSRAVVRSPDSQRDGHAHEVVERSARPDRRAADSRLRTSSTSGSSAGAYALVEPLAIGAATAGRRARTPR